MFISGGSKPPPYADNVNIKLSEKFIFINGQPQGRPYGLFILTTAKTNSCTAFRIKMYPHKRGYIDKIFD